MKPPFLINNSADLALVNSKHRSYAILRHAILIHDANLKRLIVRGFSSTWVGDSIKLPSEVGLKPSFVYAVLGVLLMSSKPQVVRVAAWRVVAAVKNAQSFWNSALCNLVGVFVSAIEFSKVFTLPIFGVFVYRKFPWPAFVRPTNINALPKPGFCERLFSPLSCRAFLALAGIISHMKTTLPTMTGGVKCQS